MKWVALLLSVAALLLAGCGGGKSDEAQIKEVWASFFSPKTPVADKPALLQDGARFTALIKSLSTNPLASQLNLKVTSVTMQGENKAKVVFSIYAGGLALVADQVGYAYKVNGKWLVGYASLCKLISLQGTTPPACQP